MFFEQFLRKSHNAKLIIALLSGLIVFLLLIIALQTINTIRTSHHNTVILVPLRLDSPTTVSTDAVDPVYLTMMANSLVSLRFNFTPKTIHAQYQSIENLLAPDVYASLSHELITEEKSIDTQNIMSSFAIQETIPDVNNLSASVSGVLSRWVGGAKMEPANTKFLLKFKNVNGTLLLTDWLEEQK